MGRSLISSINQSILITQAVFFNPSSRDRRLEAGWRRRRSWTGRSRKFNRTKAGKTVKVSPLLHRRGGLQWVDRILSARNEFRRFNLGFRVGKSEGMSGRMDIWTWVRSIILLGHSLCMPRNERVIFLPTSLSSATLLLNAEMENYAHDENVQPANNNNKKKMKFFAARWMLKVKIDALIDKFGCFPDVSFTKSNLFIGETKKRSQEKISPRRFHLLPPPLRLNLNSCHFHQTVGDLIWYEM